MRPERQERPAGNQALSDVSFATDRTSVTPATRPRRQLRVEFQSAYCAFAFGGHDIRHALHALTGRRPAWAGITRAWSCSETTARRLVAWAEHQGYSIEVIGPRAATTHSGVDRVDHPGVDQLADSDMLW